jgi:hypothetical protein
MRYGFCHLLTVHVRRLPTDGQATIPPGPLQPRRRPIVATAFQHRANAVALDLGVSPALLVKERNRDDASRTGTKCFQSTLRLKAHSPDVFSCWDLRHEYNGTSLAEPQDSHQSAVKDSMGMREER